MVLLELKIPGVFSVVGRCSNLRNGLAWLKESNQSGGHLQVDIVYSALPIRSVLSHWVIPLGPSLRI